MAFIVADSDSVVIKKVKKVSGHGHHGGAWKVAYADFVTAMMAFFLLMWLLNATTEDQRKGIADYFNPTIPVSQVSGGGTGALNGESVFAEKTLAKTGSGGRKNVQTDTDADKRAAQQREEAEAKRQAAMKALEQNLRAQLNSADAKGLARHFQTRISEKGLVIELVEVDGSALFEVGSSTPSPVMRALLDIVAKNLRLITNKISVAGHTDSLSFSTLSNYSNWELSSDRANTARRLMVNAGLEGNQIDEVVGKANTDPLVEDRSAPQNRRISITILKS